jgi:hypothetical protein
MRIWRCRSAVGLMAAVTAAVGLVVVAGPAGAATPGYWLSAADGGVFSFNAPFLGSPAGTADCPPGPMDRNEPFGTCSAIAARPDGKGYWALNGDESKVFAYGTAVNRGEPWSIYQNVSRAETPVGIAIVSTPSGNGYWVTEDTGRVFAYGDAKVYGDAASLRLAALIVGMAATRDGHGYWLVSADGGVFAFGDARYLGSLPGDGIVPNQPGIVGMATTRNGHGYWLVGADGGVFAFGDATFSGSMNDQRLNAPAVGVAANRDGLGYWLVAADGGVFAFGGAPFLGSMGGQQLNSPLLGIATRP